jgi:mutator protein MutT
MPPSSEPAIEVSAGLVFRAGRLLITRRRAGDHLGGLWEFPGGKRRADETFEACLHRELAEELGIEVEVRAPFEDIRHAYPERTVFLRFFLCSWVRHEPCALGCDAFAWIRRTELARYLFPPADLRLLDRLAADEALWSA